MIKSGVSLAGVRPELLFAVMEARAWTEKRGHEFVITSVTEGRHSKTSLHYQGAAFDMRTRRMNAIEVKACKKALDKALTRDFDVVIEKTHIHIEYQPRRK